MENTRRLDKDIFLTPEFSNNWQVLTSRECSMILLELDKSGSAKFGDLQRVTEVSPEDSEFTLTNAIVGFIPNKSDISGFDKPFRCMYII